MCSTYSHRATSRLYPSRRFAATPQYVRSWRQTGLLDDIVKLTRYDPRLSADGGHGSITHSCSTAIDAPRRDICSVEQRARRPELYRS
jgi:hypothetical protein